MVPRRRVLNFVGREAELCEIEACFPSSQAKRTRFLILHALGGQGKSQIALEYCQRSKETYRGIFWINASSETTTNQSYNNIAAELTGMSSKISEAAKSNVKLVKDHLERWQERWLLVFDNYDDPKTFPRVTEFFPLGIYVILSSRKSLTQ